MDTKTFRLLKKIKKTKANILKKQNDILNKYICITKESYHFKEISFEDQKKLNFLNGKFYSLNDIEYFIRLNN